METGIDKPEVSKESYVIDYTSPTFRTLVMEEEGGFEYRWVYGLDKLSVKVTSEGTNWWAQNVKQDILKDYTHQDRMGSTTNLTDQFGRVVGRADYNEWGQITYKDALDITSSYRRIYPQLSYTGHDWDDVLGMYYAKARFYDADTKRFVEIDPVKGNITEPLSLVPYIYCVDNPLRYTDPLGQSYVATFAGETYPMVEVLGAAGVAGLASVGTAVIAVGVVAGIIVIIHDRVAYFSRNNAWRVRKAEAQRNGVAQTSYYDFTKIEQEEQKLLHKTPTTTKQDVTREAQNEQRLLRQTQTPTTAKQDVTKLAQNEQQLLRQAQTSATTKQDFTQLAQDEQRLLHKTPAYEETTPAYVNFPPSHDPLSSGARGYMAQVECEGQDEKASEGTDSQHTPDTPTSLPQQGTVDGGVEGAPPVDAGKQGKHVPGHNNYDPQKSQWKPGETGVSETQEAWLKGKDIGDGTRVWDTGHEVGTKGETGVRVHIDGKGNIHGYPVNPGQYLH